MPEENPPSLKIRLFDNYMKIYCESADHLRDICLENNFNIDKQVSNGKFELRNLDLLDDFGTYLRENDYPYAIFRGESKRAVDYWYPMSQSTLSILPDRNASVTQDEIEALRNHGYVTLQDIKTEESPELSSINGVSEGAANFLYVSANKTKNQFG